VVIICTTFFEVKAVLMFFHRKQLIVSSGSPNTAIIVLNRIRSLILVMETQYVFSKLINEYLDIINIGFHSGSGGHTNSCANGNDA